MRAIDSRRGLPSPRAWPLAVLLVVLSGESAVAQVGAPVSSITGATWAEYRTMYSPSDLCGKDEITLWRCENASHAYALCSTRTISRNSGYMQYRASRRGKVELVYPSDRRPPMALFVYTSYANGDASLQFARDGYSYMIIDPLRGASFIKVLAPPPSANTTEVRCGGNQTLQVNYTMRLMYESGIWDR